MTLSVPNNNVMDNMNEAMYAMKRFITLSSSITLLCGTDIILWNIFHIHSESGEYSTE